VAPDPNLFHVLGRKDNQPAKAEPLRLGQWMAISGAAFTTGAGRGTSLPRALLFGLLNIRLGYWWNSGINAGDRPGRYPPGLWRWSKALPASIVRMQAKLLDEWRAYFPGPSARFWYLSDGGHFENTGLYELLRRRLPFIIAADAGQDDVYQLEDLAIVTRQGRLDFGADFNWVDPTAARAAGATGWTAIDRASGQGITPVPGWIRAHFDPDAVGPLGGLRRDGGHSAALARITYADKNAVSWLLFLKPSLQAGLPIDIVNYAATHAAFPQEPTADQFFSDGQWESYRGLGYYSGMRLFT
jgi:hypothetical protein